MSKWRISSVILCCAVLGLAVAASAAAEPEGPIVFHDPFESLTTVSGVQYTQPTVFGKVLGLAGGKVRGTVSLVAGKEGRALQLTGDTMVVYPGVEPLNLLGGEFSFWVKFNFDPNEKNEKTRGLLRNQIFVTLTAPDRSDISIYSCLNDVRLLIRNAQGNSVLGQGTPLAWEKGAWHQLKVRWGNDLTLWVDGAQKASTPWDGLFGPMQVQKEKLTMMLGFTPGGLNSEFTMDELVFRGPVEGQLACRPWMALPLLENPPTLDGNLDKDFWKNAGEVTGFVGASARELAHDQPTLYGAYTSTGLYFGLRAPLAAGALPEAVLTQRGSPVYSEDALEIYLQPPLKAPVNSYQFLMSAIGTQMDVVRMMDGRTDMTIRPDWQVKTRTRPGEWTAEVFIPFKALNLSGMPKAGEMWRGNFCLDSAKGFSNGVMWAFAGGNLTNPVIFGDLLFTGKARTLREESFAGFREGDPETNFMLVGDYAPVITLREEIFDSNAARVYDRSFKIHDSPTAAVGMKFLQAGVYMARLTAADEAGTTFFKQNVLFRPERAFALSVENYAYAGQAEVTARAKALMAKAQKVSFSVVSASNEPIATVAAMPMDKNGNVVAKVSTENLKPGEYTVEALALNDKGETVESAKQALHIYPKPAWWKNNLGLDHSVPPPWEPVKATEKGFGVWGRDYQFSESFFPQQIMNQGVALFQAAPRLMLRVGKGETDLVALHRDVNVTSFPDQVELLSTTEAEGVSVRCKGTLEFDGYSRYDVELKPSGAKTIDGLVLEVPLVTPLAKFLVPSNGSSSSVSELKMPYASPFVAHLWIGNDDMGLVFFAESQQYWTPQDGQMIEIVQSGGSALLRVNFIRSPRAISGPITFSFGLMASPVRPLPNPNDPFQHLAYGGPDSVRWPDFVSYPANGRIVPQQGTLEFRVRMTEAGAGKNLELFNFLGAADDPTHPKYAGMIQGYVLGPKIAVAVGQTGVMSGAGTLKTNEFSHLAFVWEGENVSLYLDGRQIAAAKASQGFLDSLKASCNPGSSVRIGCGSDIGGDTAIVVSDVRLSRTARYHGSEYAVPAAPLAKDEATTLLDPLDDSFIPDGQDAFTAAGGLPTVGCRFVAEKSGKGLKIEVAPARPAKEVVKELGADHNIYWNWNYGTNSETAWPPTMFNGTAPDLKEAVAAAHRAGVQMMVYTCYPAIGAPSPLADQFAPEWELQPVSILPYSPPEGHYMLNSSLSSRGYADYYTAGVAWLMDDLGMDGTYTDGIAQADASANIHGRAGYLDENGNAHPTVPIFGVREGTKRMYRVVKSRRPDGLVINHLSFNTMVPTMSFSEVNYIGEHEDYENLLNDRVRFTSKAWGIQVALLGSSEHIYASLHEMICLLHGTPTLGYGVEGRNDIGRKLINIHKAYLRADTKTAQWVPYFKNDEKYYTTDDPKVKMSFYYHSGKDAFLIVGNLEAKDKTATLRLKLNAFGLDQATLRAQNALTEQPLTLAADGTLTVPVRAKSFTLVSLTQR